MNAGNLTDSGDERYGSFRIIRLKETGSTNEWAGSALASGLIPPDTLYAVTADYQTAGRGNGNTKWISDPGQNLLLSLIIPGNDFPASGQFFLNMAVSVSLMETVSHYVSSPGVSIKWPNDIYIGDRKVAGILIRHTVTGSVIGNTIAGVGLNLNQTRFVKSLPNPVSILQITGKTVNRDECLHFLLDRFEKHLESLCRGEVSELKEVFHRSLFRLNEWHSYKYRGGLIRARIQGVSSYGFLMLETEERKMIECDLKEIEFIL
ncbi:MAG: biotin--[acetyl-CoA-carboxylase] ligase [Bacteroidales bacterium]